MTHTCQHCQNWAGAADSVTAYCTLPRPGIAFTVTGRDASCTAFKTTDISAQGQAADEGTTGTPEHIEIMPANYRPMIETWTTLL